MSVAKPRRYTTPSGEGRWMVDVILGLPDAPAGAPAYRKRKYGFRTRGAAWEWGVRHEREVIRGGPPSKRQEVPNLSALVDEFLEWSRVNGGRRGPVGDTWADRQRSAFRIWVAPRLGELKVTEVDERRLADLVKAMRTADPPRKPRTIRNTLDVVRGALQLAKRHRLIATLPEFPHVHLDRPKRLTHAYEEAHTLIEAARQWNDPASLPVVALVLFASLRAGEVMGLRWEDVDLEGELLHVRRSVTCRGAVKAPKTEAGERTIPLAPTLAAALREWRARAPVGVPWVFHADRAPVSHKWLKVRVLPVLRRAGLAEGEPLQRLRRTFVTQAKSRGIPYDQVLRWSGHEVRADDVSAAHYTGEFPMDLQREWIALLEEPPLHAAGGSRGDILATWRRRVAN